MPPDYDSFLFLPGIGKDHFPEVGKMINGTRQSLFENDTTDSKTGKTDLFFPSRISRNSVERFARPKHAF